jgi:hypothetical protein
MPTKSGMPTHQELRSLPDSEIISRIDAFMSGTPSDWRLLSAQLFLRLDGTAGKLLQGPRAAKLNS